MAIVAYIACAIDRGHAARAKLALDDVAIGQGVGKPSWNGHGNERESSRAPIILPSNEGRGDEIWLRSGDALSDRRLLTPDDFAGSRPDHIRALTFSRDGQWLAFTTYTFRPSLDCGVWVMPISGGTPRRVSKDVLATRGTWSPDGRQMALYLIRNGSTELWITSIGTSELRQVTLPEGLGLREMEWSPTGELIGAFEARFDGGPAATSAQLVAVCELTRNVAPGHTSVDTCRPRRNH